jgi:hypothetical protein
MDDMRQIRDFRAEINGADGRAASEARRRLMERIAGDRRQGGFGFLRLPLVAGVAAATLGAVLIVPQLGDGDGAAEAEAAEVLSQLGEVAASQPQPGQSTTGVEGEGGYRYVHVQRGEFDPRASGDSGEPGQIFDEEIWVAPDGSGRILTQAPEGRGGDTNDTMFGPGVPCEDPNPGKPNCNLLTYIDFSSYPTEADELFTVIENEAAEGIEEDIANGVEPGDKDFLMFQIVGHLLGQPAPADLRVALYEVAGRIPGIELLGEVTDPLGRPGIGFAMDVEGEVSVENPGSGQPHKVSIRNELIFDPDTAQLLAQSRSMTLLEPTDEIPEGMGSGWTAYLESGIVASTEERPAD